MKKFFANFHGSFLPSRARRELLLFLETLPDLNNEILWQLAKKHLKKLNVAINNNNKINDNEIKNFILHNHDLLEGERKKVLIELTKKAIPGFDWVPLLKNIGLFALCLVPAIYYLLEAIFTIANNY